jgi:hypothetical protein
MLANDMDKNAWKVGAAKQRFSEVLRRSEQAPQLIYRRDRLVAAVISVDNETEVPGVDRATIAQRFAEIRDVIRRERYRLPPAPRKMRSNDFVSSLDDVAG